MAESSSSSSCIFTPVKVLMLTDYASSCLPAAALQVIWRDALTLVHISLIIFISPWSLMPSLASVFNIIATSTFSFWATVSFTSCQSLAGIHPEKLRYMSRKKSQIFIFSHTTWSHAKSNHAKKQKLKQPRELTGCSHGPILDWGHD